MCFWTQLSWYSIYFFLFEFKIFPLPIRWYYFLKLTTVITVQTAKFKYIYNYKFH